MPVGEDLGAYLDPDFGHGTAATIGGRAVYGVYDHPFGEVLGAATEAPTFLCREADARVDTGDTIAVRGIPYTIRGREPDGTGLVTLILEEYRGDAGDGLHINFNAGYLVGETGKKQNDHGILKIGSTFHFIGITAPIADTGSKDFAHYTSVDCRTWTRHDDIEIGTDILGNWRCQVWAAHPFLNPAYGETGLPAGCYADYKYLMLFTGNNKQGSGGSYIDAEQKIGLAGAADDDAVDAGTWTILNDDAPIYWVGMDDTGNGGSDAGGATWAMWQDWARASRDPDTFTLDDGAQLLLITARHTSGYNCLGLARFNLSGAFPIWDELTHEPAPLLVATGDSGSWVAESSRLRKIGSLWHLFVKGYNGTRHQSADAYTGPAGGWETTKYDGAAMTTDGPSSAEASEFATGIADDLEIISGHKAGSGFYWYKFLELDYSAVAAEGDHPAATHLGQIAGLRALRAGELDNDFRLHGAGSLVYPHAFSYQPVIGDEPEADGGDAAGMTGTSYINTAFLRYYPGQTAGSNAPDTLHGWIYSDAFTVTKLRAELAIAGDKNAGRQFVALVDADDGAIYHLATGNDSHVLRAVTWDLAPLIGLSVRLVVADLADSDNPKTYGISVDYWREFTPADGAVDVSAPIPPVLVDVDSLEDRLADAGATVKVLPW